MSRAPSDKTKQKRGMGTGYGADHKPYILTSEFNSLGTTSVIRDWKTGRGVHCLSQGEAMWYYILRWDDNNLDIQEQSPLKNEDTVAIAQALGFRHPKNNSYIMTTDFVAVEADGTLHAYSIKASKDSLTDRDYQKLAIEKLYWKTRKQKTQYTLLFKTDANEILYNNIRLVVEFYDPESVFDKYSLIEHKIAIKEWTCDMEHEFITNQFLDKVWEKNK